MSWAAVIIGGATLASGYLSGEAAEDAAEINAEATDAQIAEMRRQFDLVWESGAPYREAGEGAINLLDQLLVTGEMDANTFMEGTPGYEFGRSEGQKQIERSQAGAGMSLSGAAQKELVRYNQDYATTKYNEEVDKLFRMAGYGSSAVGTGSQAAIQTGAGISQAIGQGAANQANIGMWNAQNQNNALMGGVNSYLTMQMYNDMMAGGGR